MHRYFIIFMFYISHLFRAIYLLCIFLHIYLPTYLSKRLCIYQSVQVVTFSRRYLMCLTPLSVCNSFIYDLSIQVGDILLKVSGVPLSSLNLRQALDILRTSPPTTCLLVNRLFKNCFFYCCFSIGWTIDSRSVGCIVRSCLVLPVAL